MPPKIFPPALVEDELPSDLFSAIFKSDSHQCSWRALLAHAIALHRPLLAILAACYEVVCYMINIGIVCLYSNKNEPAINYIYVIFNYLMKNVCSSASQ